MKRPANRSTPARRLLVIAWDCAGDLPRPRQIASGWPANGTSARCVITPVTRHGVLRKNIEEALSRTANVCRRASRGSALACRFSGGATKVPAATSEARQPT